MRSLDDPSKPSERRGESLRDVWKGKGFERIEDLEMALREAKRELGKAILDRKLQ